MPRLSSDQKFSMPLVWTLPLTYCSAWFTNLWTYSFSRPVAFRYNERKHEDGDAGRFIEAAGSIFGRRLTYSDLTGKDSQGEISGA